MEKDSLEEFVGEVIEGTGIKSTEEIKREVDESFTQTFGSNWQTLPVRSIQGAIALYILDQILAPRGITPRKLAESAIELKTRYMLDEKFEQFLENVKQSGSITLEMTKEVVTEIGESFKEVFEILEAGVIVGLDFAQKTFKKGAEEMKKKLHGLNFRRERREPSSEN